MASQLGRQYCQPSQLHQNGVPMANTANKNTEPLPSEGGKGELLVKQTYWEYDDFMNTNIRNPPKKCYYEMMSRDEFNIRQDLCKDLEMKRNHIIEKMERDSHASTEDCLPYGADTQHLRNSGLNQQMLESDHQSKPSTPQDPQSFQSPQRRGGIPRSIDNEDCNIQQRQNQNPRPRSLPYHMRSSANFQPRPGPGVVSQAGSTPPPPPPPPPNEACYYSCMNNSVINRMKQPQYRSPAPPVSHADTYTTYSNSNSSTNHNSNNTTNNDNPNNISIGNNGNNVHVSEKYYEPLRPAKPIQRYQSATPAATRYEVAYSQTSQIPEPALQDSRQPPMAQYETNEQQSAGVPSSYSSSKVDCILKRCPSSCSCSSRENSKVSKKPNGYQNQNSQRSESERQYRVNSGIESIRPQQHRLNRFEFKPEVSIERNQMLSQGQHDSPRYNSAERQYTGGNQSLMPMPIQRTVNARYEGNISPNQRPSAYGAAKRQTLARSVAVNTRQRRPLDVPTPVLMPPSPIQMQSQNFQCSPQSQLQPSSTIPSPVIASQPLANPLSQSAAMMQQAPRQPSHCLSSSSQQPQQTQIPQPPASVEIRNPSQMIPSEQMRSDGNGIPPTEGYVEYTQISNITDYGRQPSHKQSYASKTPLKTMRQLPPYEYDWPQSHPQCDSGETWIDPSRPEYSYSDIDNCDLDEGDDDYDDDNSW